MAPDPFWRHVTLISAYGVAGGSKKWRCNYCGMEKTGSVTRVKDHLACIPNKDIGPCANVSADVKASLETWHRTRLGLGMHEESSQHGGDEIDVSQVEAEPEASSSSSQSEEQPSDDEMEHASSDDA
ncbi:hypothetical protein L7F22_030233 [Adiantum nelumboides]|nr:hypothetical protein [Adiantum nelumboides]